MLSISTICLLHFKEQLVEMTGLSARVIRVWFQNKRCKDKKKSIEYKAQIEQEKVIKNPELSSNGNFNNKSVLFQYKGKQNKPDEWRPAGGE